jgi:hypothetical protein
MTQFGLDPAKAPPAVRASQEPIIRFFSYHDAHPVALAMVLQEKFRHFWIDYEAETLRFEILATFKATSISDHNWAKIQAVRTLMSSDSFWSAWEVFEKVIQSLNNNLPTFEVAQRCTVAQLMAGVDMASQVRQLPFNEEVLGYISASSIEEGITYLPDPLEFAQQTLSQPHYECLVCGNHDDLDLEDGRCDVCVDRWSDHRPTGKPAEYADPSWGTNIRKYLLRDPKGVKSRFNEIKDLKTADVDEESVVDVQAAKLAVAHQYVKLRRSQLVEQLERLKSWVSA